ncbi:MAG: hypothetical protein AAGB22_01945 [Bacteroidota bacterium]
MAKKQKTFDKVAWVGAYKDYVLHHGERPAPFKSLAEFADQPYANLLACFDSLELLEAAVVLLYFKQTNELLEADEKFEAHSDKEKHLAFLYVLMEKTQEEEVFLKEFQRLKRWDQRFAMSLFRMLNAQEFEWTAPSGWGSATLDRLHIRPRQTALIHHALTVMAYSLRDQSAEKQDTDAFIEKSTDVLFRITDSGTLRSVVDLGKFLMSRNARTFSWE